MGILGLTVNMNIEVKLEEEICKSNVQAIDEEKFYIAMPMKNGQYLLPHIEDRIEITYNDRDCIYSFRTEVIGRFKENNVALLELRNPKNVQKIQRRKFVRVSIIENVTYWELQGKDLENVIKKNITPVDKTFKGVLLDISGGGARVLLESKLDINSLILLDIPLQKDNLRIPGKIVWIDKDELGRFSYGVNFELISEAIRDKIIRNTFDIMRKQRKSI